VPKTTIEQLGEYGQSIWLDYISRPLLTTGKLQSMIGQGLRGMTSNPSLFNEAISNSSDYDESIASLSEAGKSPFEIYDDLTIQDIKDACDIFLPLYKQTNFLDGYVSLEINPKLAMDTTASIKEGVRLFRRVAHPNVMIKVPATDAGFPVIEALLAQGINVNTTLIFSLGKYEKTALAFIKGAKCFLEKGGDLKILRSVASVFVSRVDTAVDKLLGGRLPAEKNEAKQKNLKSLYGKAAVANSKIIFRKFEEIFSGSNFLSLKKKGCDVQRVLWGSTGTKNPAYSDIKYVTELIARPTVNTLPEKTINAFLGHGIAKEAFSAENIGDASEIVSALSGIGISVDKVCEQLLADGVLAFEKAFDALLFAIETKARNLSQV